MATNRKPMVRLIGMGGSISMLGHDRIDYTDYGSTGRSLTIDEMLARIPEVEQFARVTTEQMERVASNSFGPAHWVKLAKRINAIFRGEPESRGVAIAHGTLTLEETAYFLNLTVKSDRPVVVTGAMRPSTALGTDADTNLLNCIQVAASPDSRGKGVLVVLNNEIQAARDVTKTNTHRVETFRSPHFGFLGYADADHRVVFYRTPTRRHTYQTEFDVDSLEEMPRADIVYAYAGGDGVALRAFSKAGAQGIVLAAMGSGRVPPDMEKAAEEAIGNGVVVVRASQSGTGRVVPTGQDLKKGFIAADNLSPKKARILLMCALTMTRDPQRIGEMFNQY